MPTNDPFPNLRAIDFAIKRIEALPLPRGVRSPSVDEVATIMVDQPWRIGRAMGDQPWHHVDESYAAKLIRCRDKIAKLERLSAAGHWAFNGDDLLALKQAERALEILTTAAALTGEAA